MRRTTGEECECLSMKAHDKSVSSGGKLTSRSWMAGQGVERWYLKIWLAEVSFVSLVSTFGEAKCCEFVNLVER